MKARVAIIVINWNGKHLLEECLNSIEKQDYENFKIIFVDNGSIDGSVGFVREKFSKIDVIELKENTGFAYANNVGMHRAFEDPDVKYVAILNNDAMVEKSWLSEMMKVIERDGKIGSVAPKIRKYYKRDVIDSIGNAIHMDGGGVSNHINETDNGQYDNILELFGPSGCAALYSKEMLKDVEIFNEFFDNDFFAYFEDIDLNWRARLRGWKCYFASKALVYHKHSETTGLYSPFKAFYTHRNRYFVVIKNFPINLLPKAAWSLLGGYAYSILSIKKNKGPSARFVEKSGFLEAIKIITKGWADILMNTPKMIKKRIYIQKHRVVSDKDIKEWLNKYKLDYKKVLFNEHIK